MAFEKTEEQLVNDFSKKMTEKILLRRDRYSPAGWNTLDLKRIIWLLEGELQELKSILSKPETGNALVHSILREEDKFALKDNAVDIANYAMFIHEIIK